MSQTIKVYTTTQCTRCTTTKRWLTRRGIEHEVIDVTENPLLIDAIREVAADLGVPATMPLVEIHYALGAEPIQWFDFRVDLLTEHFAAA